MYANDDSDTESTSKATTSGRSQGKLAPIQVFESFKYRGLFLLLR